MKRIFLAVFLLVVLVAGAMLVLPGMIDWDRYRDEIVAQLHDATGYEYKIGGPIELAVLPYPRLKLSDLAITNPPRAQQPLLTLENAAVSVKLMPLLQGKVIVDSIALNKPVIHLEIGSDGKPSWMTPELEAHMVPKADTGNDGAGKNKTGFAEAVSLDSITIKDGSLFYTDYRKGTTQSLEKIDLDIGGDTLTGPFEVSGNVVYNGQKIGLTLKTGRINADTNSVAVQAELTEESTATQISFSGVTGLKGVLDAQGSTTISTNSVGGLPKLAGNPEIPALAGKPLKVTGILTAAPAQITYKDLKISYAGTDASGDVTVVPPQQEGAPLELSLALNAAQPLDLGGMLPAPSTAPADKDDGKLVPKPKAPGFLPDNLLLPARVTASLSVSAPGLRYNDMAFGETRMAATLKDKALNATINTVPPGGGRFDASAALANAALTYKLSLDAEDGAKAALAFVPGDKIQNILPLLHDKLDIDAAGSVKPAVAQIDSAAITLGKTQLALSGSYANGKPEGRDLLTLALSTPQIDIDALQARMNPQVQTPAQPATAPEAKQSVADALGKLALPFDFDLSVAAKNVRLKGTDYQSLDLQARLTGKKLDLKTLQLKDKKGNDFLLAGTAADIAALHGLDLDAQGKTANLRALLDGFGVNTTSLPASLAAAELVSEFKGDADNLSFTANVKAMGGTAEAAGALGNILKTPEISKLTLRLRHPDYAELVKLFNPDFRSAPSIKKTLDLYATMTRSGKAYSFSDLNATVGPATITGTLKADMGGAKPAITADLKTGDFPLGQLLGYEAKGGSVAAPSASAQPVPQPTRWSRNAINTDWMQKFNMALKIASSSFSYGTWNLSNAQIEANLIDGTLTVTKIDGGMYGGQASFSGVMASSGKPRDPLNVSGKASLQNVSLESFVSSFSGAKILQARGSISVDAEAQSSGLSPAALVNALQGKGQASGSSLVLEGFDLARLSRTLAQPSSSMKENAAGLIDATMQGGSTSFDTLSSAFTINEGVVDFNTLKLVGKDATVSTLGKVNLPLWTLDMESSVTLVTPANAPPLKVVFRGPLDQPGKTFGRSALEGYIQQVLGAQVQTIIQDKLGDKIKGPEAQILQGILGVPLAPPAKNQPQVDNGAVPPPLPQTAPEAGDAAPATPPPPAGTTDDFNGVLQNVIQGR